MSDIIKNFTAAKLLDESFKTVSGRDLIREVKEKAGIDFEKSLALMDMIEYGRMLHAEMNAITDAARKGISLDGSTLYCTTFPCHLCAKHIIATGIRRVVYIEPYPKAHTQELYRGEIKLGRMKNPEQGLSTGKVWFEPFIGIAPYRYSDFFEKRKRKKNGEATEWQNDPPLPIIKVTSEGYVADETDYLRVLIGKFAEEKVLLPDSFATSLAKTGTGD